MKYISAETVFFIMMKAREFDVKIDPEGLSKDAGDGSEVLEDYADHATEEELLAALSNLNSDQLHELVALTWLGRGSFSREEWDEAYNEAADADPEGATTPAYLMGTPLLSDYLEEGLSQLGVSVEEFEETHL